MRKKQLQRVMIPLWGLTVVYLLLAQLATTSDPLHQWLHGNWEIEKSCCHNEREPSSDQHPTSDSKKSDSHSCFVSMLASGVLGKAVLTIDVPSIPFDPAYAAWNESPEVLRISSNQWARAPPIFASL